MNDLIWVGNTLYPRYFVFAVVVAIICAPLVVAAGIGLSRRLIRWIKS